MNAEDMRKADTERIEAAMRMLGEHFDTVQIFTTRCEEGILGGTVTAEKGCGNWFARYGQVRCWIVKQEEEERITKLREMNAEDEE